MSEKPENNTSEQPKDDAPESGASTAWNPTAEPPPKAAEPAPAKPASKGSSPIAWLALLLIIAMAVAAGWFYQQTQLKEAALERRLTQLESVEDTQKKSFQELDQRLQAGLQAQLKPVAARASGQDAQLENLEAMLIVQRDEIARFGATDRQDWLLAEAEYLLRLANQRLIMAGDVVAATALLNSADSILLELQDVGLHSVRAAVAADLAALRAVPKVDVEGMYLQLAALIGQVEQLAIFELPDNVVVVETAADDDWQARLQQGYEEALHKLSDYIVIRRRDVPYEALMEPAWEGLVRQNLRMLLEQAQVALLSGNQVLFQQSLERAGHWVQQFFEVDESGARALAADLTRLRNETVAVDLPDISSSQHELDKAIERRLQREGGQ
ncbi:MAG: uroporphyrinogen-III C-methyltransferase [Halioglobus sp.]